jgi:hypothetical protein
MQKDEGGAVRSCLVIRHSLGIRHSTFVIS